MTHQRALQLCALLKSVGHQAECSKDLKGDCNLTCDFDGTVLRLYDRPGAARVSVPDQAPVHQARYLLRTFNLKISPSENAMGLMLKAVSSAPLSPDEWCGASAQLGALAPLLDLHQGMDLRLLEHRLCLMRGDINQARLSFERFKAPLLRHIQHEEELVLTRYAERPPHDGFERGGAPELFSREHQKLRDHVERVKRSLEMINEQNDEHEVACLQLLDREKVLVDLLEHHDLRERTFLYPGLVKVLSAAEQRALVTQMARLSWD